MRLAIYELHPEPRKIRRAADILRDSGVIAYPTDTVYGLCCRAHDKKAIERIYKMKRMDRTQPLALMCPDLSEIARYAIVDNMTYRTLKRAFPGPYCFVLNATREVPRMLQSKQKTVGIRVPASPVVQALLAEVDAPLVTTTASWEGEVLVDPADIDDRFRDLDLVLDAGVADLEPSTVIDLTGAEPKVLREGKGSLDGLL